MNRTLSLITTVGLSALMFGCASAPEQNAKIEEARMIYNEIEEDPYVARSGSSQLRSARTELDRAQALLEDDEDLVRVEHAAYLAKRHAEIAEQQGLRAELEEEISSAEKRRQDIMLQLKSNEAEALRAQMEALQAEKTERGMVLTLGDVLFDLNKADLKPAGMRTVQRLSDFMLQYEDRRVRVEGYTDSTGSESYNQDLSERRAMAVRDALMAEGVARSRVEVMGYGEAYPVASNDTSAGRQQNRRVEIVISDENGVIQTR
ncbi:outer membrane protein OmpA-like peptidoglycan-associated protein [Marinobacter pelagius]|uniref:Outer membrane protein OmpA-like peptidoglycan-associated protein n=1 Tax=Marinobacter pelagius TaxID=379482 RepID=A0A366GWW5_9GAMM|nr:OmpA family protein [Marinobacter pelagius]RBP32581.1 outer membrane protein OmpA-like peptidoglycan-associated protein [Marinobacter pelagius]